MSRSGWIIILMHSSLAIHCRSTRWIPGLRQRSSNSASRAPCVPPPHPAFVARLEHRLRENATSVRPAPISLEIARAHGRGREGLARSTYLLMPKRTARFVAWTATAALLVLALAASFGILRLGFIQPNDGGVPLNALQTGTTADVCHVQPRQIVPAPPRTGSPEGLLPTLPDGEPGVLDSWAVAGLQEDTRPATPETVARIADLLKNLAACQNQPDADPARAFALFTDAYLFFALDMAAMSPPRDITGQSLRERLATLPQPALGPGEPDIEGVWMLPEGEAGAIVRPRAGSAHYMVFTRADGHWLIDELAVYPFPTGFVPPVGTPPTLAESLLELAAVAMFDILYVPETLTIPADTAVTLALTNAGQVDHAFVIDALGIDVRLQPGETRTITIEAPTGTYEYFSDIPGQRDAGMIGTLTAVSTETTTFATPTA